MDERQRRIQATQVGCWQEAYTVDNVQVEDVDTAHLEGLINAHSRRVERRVEKTNTALENQRLSTSAYHDEDDDVLRWICHT